MRNIRDNRIDRCKDRVDIRARGKCAESGIRFNHIGEQGCVGAAECAKISVPWADLANSQKQQKLNEVHDMLTRGIKSKCFRLVFGHFSILAGCSLMKGSPCANLFRERGTLYVTQQPGGSIALSLNMVEH